MNISTPKENPASANRKLWVLVNPKKAYASLKYGVGFDAGRIRHHREERRDRRDARHFQCRQHRHEGHENCSSPELRRAQNSQGLKYCLDHSANSTTSRCQLACLIPQRLSLNKQSSPANSRINFTIRRYSTGFVFPFLSDYSRASGLRRKDPGPADRCQRMSVVDTRADGFGLVKGDGWIFVVLVLGIAAIGESLKAYRLRRCSRSFPRGRLRARDEFYEGKISPTGIHCARVRLCRPIVLPRVSDGLDALP